MNITYQSFTTLIRKIQKETTGDIYDIYFDGTFIDSWYIWGSCDEEDSEENRIQDIFQRCEQYLETKRVKKIVVEVRRDLQGGSLEKTYTLPE